MDWRQALAVGFGLNARGAMEILLGSLAFQAGLITQPIFVALVVMALVTSVTSAPMIRYFLKQR
jgi:Kef-type K+ transport system membrane component KefB